MSSTFAGLNIGLSALVANQTAMDVSAQNTANANTDGYSRQQVEMVASTPYPVPAFNRSGQAGQMGTGVTVAAIQRVRDAFVDQQYRQENAVLGQWTTRQNELSQVETVFPEPGTSGIGTALSQFWASWQDLAASPTSTAAMATVVEQGQNLAAAINSAATQLSSAVSGIDYQVGQQVDQINTLATQIASLNQQIQAVTVSGQNANDLSDQRDLALDKLSAIVPIDVQPQQDGTVSVSIGGVALVSGSVTQQVATAADANGHLDPTWASTGGQLSIGSDEGSLGALLSLRDTKIPVYQSQLDALAGGVASAVNAAYEGTLAGTASATPFFTDGSGDGGVPTAANIAVNTVFAGDPATNTAGDPTQLAQLSGAVAPAGGGTPTPFATIAGNVADLQQAQLSFSVGGQATQQTATDFYANLVGQVGSDAQQASTMQGNQNLIVQHLTSQRESVSGVSLDEEATNMILFQRGYDAASRVITAMDQMLDQLINHTGVVGL